MTSPKLAEIVAAITLCFAGVAAAQTDSETLERNKEIARAFYDDLWFNDNTGKYADYVADKYVVFDTGDRKNAREPAIMQKEIADFFWSHGGMSGEIDYQIAEGDLVATRWQLHFEPKSLFGHVMLGPTNIPIINVFRFEDGKIVEIWNHRHDIDTRKTLPFALQGFGLGLLVALIPAIYAFRLRRKLKRIG